MHRAVMANVRVLKVSWACSWDLTWGWGWDWVWDKREEKKETAQKEWERTNGDRQIKVGEQALDHLEPGQASDGQT